VCISQNLSSAKTRITEDAADFRQLSSVRLGQIQSSCAGLEVLFDDDIIPDGTADIDGDGLEATTAVEVKSSATTERV